MPGRWEQKDNNDFDNSKYSPQWPIGPGTALPEFISRFQTFSTNFSSSFQLSFQHHKWSGIWIMDDDPKTRHTILNARLLVDTVMIHEKSVNVGLYCLIVFLSASTSKPCGP